MSSRLDCLFSSPTSLLPNRSVYSILHQSTMAVVAGFWGWCFFQQLLREFLGDTQIISEVYKATLPCLPVPSSAVL